MANKFSPTREWLLQCGATEEDLERCDAIGVDYYVSDSGDMWLARDEYGDFVAGAMAVPACRWHAFGRNRKMEEV
jgi:hypothetical protein